MEFHIGNPFSCYREISVTLQSSCRGKRFMRSSRRILSLSFHNWSLTDHGLQRVWFDQFPAIAFADYRCAQNAQVSISCALPRMLHADFCQFPASPGDSLCSELSLQAPPPVIADAPERNQSCCGLLRVVRGRRALMVAST